MQFLSADLTLFCRENRNYEKNNSKFRTRSAKHCKVWRIRSVHTCGVTQFLIKKEKKKNSLVLFFISSFVSAINERYIFRYSIPRVFPKRIKMQIRAPVIFFFLLFFWQISIGDFVRRNVPKQRRKETKIDRFFFLIRCSYKGAWLLADSLAWLCSLCLRVHGWIIARIVVALSFSLSLSPLSPVLHRSCIFNWKCCKSKRLHCFE